VRGKRVVKKRVKQYPLEFRRRAVERMKSCENISLLIQELGISRDSLYTWRKELELIEPWLGEEAARLSLSDTTLRRQVHQLKRVLAEKTMEVDFFKGALQKVEARRQKSGISGEKGSMTKSKN
jgi:transposase-like protein